MQQFQMVNQQANYLTSLISCFLVVKIMSSSSIQIQTLSSTTYEYEGVIGQQNQSIQL